LSTDVNSCLVDNVSEVVVVLSGGNKESLFSVPDDQFFGMANMAIIGEEIVSFRRARYLEDGSVAISGFLRGRFGTEEYCKSHDVNDRFIFFDASRLIKIVFHPGDIGKEIIIKAQSRGMSFDESPETRFVLSQESIVDLEPVDVVVEDVSDGLSINWSPRSKSEFIFFDDSDKANDTRYNLIIHDRQGRPVRKIFVANENVALYTKAMQIQDFGEEVVSSGIGLEIEGAI
jgi:hypothetical protein